MISLDDLSSDSAKETAEQFLDFIRTLKSRGADEDIIVVIVSMLDDMSELEEIAQWISDNPKATARVILDKLREMHPEKVEVLDETSNWFILHYCDSGEDASIRVNTDDMDIAIAIFKKERAGFVITYIESVNADTNEVEIIYRSDDKQKKN